MRAAARVPTQVSPIPPSPTGSLMEDNKILYAVYYDPKLSHAFTGPSPPGMTLPPLNFRHTVQNSKRSVITGDTPSEKAHTEVKKDSAPPPIPAPARTRTKRKLSYSDNLVTFPVEGPAGQKKGRLSGNHTGRAQHREHNESVLWGLPSGGSSSSDFQEGQSMSSISSYASLSSSFMPSVGSLQAMQFAAQTQAKMDPPIDPLLINRVHATGNAKTDATHAAVAVLDKAGVSPLEMLLVILDPAHAEFEKERAKFFAQENHANIHALLTNLQTNTRLRQNFSGAMRGVPTGAGLVPAHRLVSEDGAALSA